MDKPNVISLPEVPKVVHPELENHFIVQIDEWAFNPSIIKHEGRTLLAWRTGWHNQSALRIGELDQHYNLIWVRPINTDRLLQAYGHHAGVEDARLFIHHGKLHIAFTLNVVPRDNRTRAFGTMAGQGVLQLDQHFVADQCWVFDGGDRWEKNWQFFSHSGELLAVYEPLSNTIGSVGHDGFSLRWKDPKFYHWTLGTPSGGTPPLRLGDEYFSFFHSKVDGIYYAALYAFEARKPFRITRWPKAPCLQAGIAPWRAVEPHVVFPCGAIFEDDEWLVSYGWNDMFCCLAKFNHTQLLEQLVQTPVHSEPGSITHNFTFL